MYTYEYYAASSADEARLFLSYREVTKPLYYIQVETPEGIWGLDRDGLYLAELLPFQKNLSLSRCTGKITSINPVSIGMQMAANGKADNFICGIACGSCGYEWQDGVFFGKIIVKCPKCGKYNCVDTSAHIERVEYGNGQVMLKSTVQI
jgi:hypothetical protein